MTPRTSFTPESQVLIRQLYLDGVPPREIQSRLRDDLKFEVKGPALRQWIKRAGLPAQKRSVEASLMAKIDPAAIAAARAEKVQGHLDRWAEKAATVVDRALDAAATAPSIRDVAIATGAAAQGLRIVQTCTGVGAPSGPHVSINVGFATGPDSPFHPANVARRAVVVEVDTPTATPSPA
jgi:hypothetical protein